MRDGPRDLVRLVQTLNARQALPCDLAAWVVDLATAAISDPERKRTRNRLLREAGALIGGSPWGNQAKGIRTELLKVIRLWTYYVRCPPPPGSLTALMVEVLTIDPSVPTSMTQLWRILTCIDAADESEPACEDRFHAQ